MKKFLALLLVILLAVVLGTPFCRYGMVGLIRGESFYQGRPTSYWRGAVKDRAVLINSLSVTWGDFTPPPTVLDKVHAFLDQLFPREIEHPP